MPLGSKGTVVGVGDGGEAFEVEFVRPVEILAAIDPKALPLVERTEGCPGGHRLVHEDWAAVEGFVSSFTQTGLACRAVELAKSSSVIMRRETKKADAAASASHELEPDEGDHASTVASTPVPAASAAAA